MFVAVLKHDHCLNISQLVQSGGGPAFAFNITVACTNASGMYLSAPCTYQPLVPISPCIGDH